MSGTLADAILRDPAVRAGLRQAWHDSHPGIVGGHEEGGFILRDTAGRLRVARWPGGEQNHIVLPPHPACKAEGSEIVATFHTHPNTGPGFLQEPSETDRRAVRDDPDLKGEAYEGEVVISAEWVYLVSPRGEVSVAGRTSDIVTEPSRG